MAKKQVFKNKPMTPVKPEDEKVIGIKQVKKPAPGKFGPRHPVMNAKANVALVKFIKERLDFANDQRAQQIARLYAIDTEISGFLTLSKQDAQRERDNRAGKGVKPTIMSLELVKTQLDEAATYLLNVFVPTSGIFEAVATPDKQEIANGVATKLNQDGDRKQYYRQYAKAFGDMLKYNLGGWFIRWEKQMGTTIKNTAGQNQKQLVPNQLVWEGNNIEAIDPYNFLWDRAVAPPDVPEKGEFFAVVDVNREFRIRKMEADGEIFNIQRFITKSGGNVTKYYQPKPALRLDLNVDQKSGNNQTDWVSFMSGSTSGHVANGIEIVYYFGWIIPADFGLSDSPDLEIWLITMMANDYIVAAEKMQNAHGLLPCALSTPIEDGLGSQSKSLGETLIPTARFASSLLNTHILGARKALYGHTFYDPSIIPYGDIGDDVAAKIPIKAKGYGKPIGDSIHQVFDGPNTDNTLQDLNGILALMQKLLPTDMKQVADLDRATQYQAAATVQGANRRSQKIAKLIEDQAMKNVRFQVMYNLMQFPTVISVVDQQSGQTKEIQVSDIIDAQLEFSISEGLKGIDKLQLIDGMKEILSWIIQNAEAAKSIDVVKLLNYWSELLGDKTDFNQFRQMNPFTQLDPEIQQALITALQQGALNPIIQKVQEAQQQNSMKKQTGVALPAPAQQPDPNADPNQQQGPSQSSAQPGSGQMPALPAGGQIPPGMGGQ